MQTIMTIENPKVSVLVPVYNVERYVERCARSLFAQTLDDVEYVFVDDCSQDDSLPILQAVMREYPHRRVSIVRHERNMGLAAARKTAFENAKGDYWICCDSDDWVDPSMYETMLLAAEESGADIVCCGMVMEQGEATPVTYDYETETRKEILDPDRFGWLYGAVWNKLVRASLYRENGIMPWEGINMWEDSCLTLRLRLASRQTVILPGCYYHYNVTNSGSITHLFCERKVREMVEAARRLAAFLATVEDGDRLANHLKLQSKEILLRYPSRESYGLFRATFPEADLWHYSQWSWAQKVRAQLVMMLPPSVSAGLMKAYRRLASACGKRHNLLNFNEYDRKFIGGG